MKSFVRFLSLATLVGIILSGAGCAGSKAQKAAAEQIQLTVWGVFDKEDAYTEILSAYRSLHPNVTVTYKQMRYEEYRDALIRALAKGDGPDVFALRNTWVGEYKDLLAPLPDTLTLPSVEIKGALKKEKVVTLKTEKTMSQRDLRQQFADVVFDDVVADYQPDLRKPPVKKIFALPLALDTLALFVNRDLLNAAGIAKPPVTWDDFLAQVRKLTRLDANGKILQAGAAMGTGKNIDRAPDILSVLMMQSGTSMVSDNGRPAFGQPNAGGTSPALEALRFYTDFANTVKDAYTWNEDQPNALDAFVSGKVAFSFGYAYHLPTIKSRAPKLNLEIVPLPQLSDTNAVNAANYWVSGTSKASAHQDWAWDFIQFASAKEHVKEYLAKTGKPSALRALIAEEQQDEKIGVFASQVLTAKNWYHGSNHPAAEQAFRDLIGEVLAGSDPQAALIRAQNKVSQNL